MIELLDFTEADLEFIYYGLSHPKVIPYYGFVCHSFDDAIIELEWYQKQINEKLGHWWKIHDRGVDLGAIGFNHFNKESGEIECGFWLLPEFWGRGLTLQLFPVALEKIKQELPIKKVVGVIESENRVTLQLVKKLGFKEIKTDFNAEIKHDKPIHLVYVELNVNV